jgi:hypothetical protein
LKRAPVCRYAHGAVFVTITTIRAQRSGLIELKGAVSNPGCAGW